jgi:hypothetical protein
LEEARDARFLLKPLQAVSRARRKADIDDCVEGLAAAEVLAGARYEPPRNLPRIARAWVEQNGFVSQDDHLKLAVHAVEKIATKSELADSWKEAGKLGAWQHEVRSLTERLNAALRATSIQRQARQKVQRETLAELIIFIATDRTENRRAELRKKLERLSNPDQPVGGKLNGQKLNALTPLHWVASGGLVPEAKLLLARGAKVDAKLPAIAPAIHFAMEAGHTEMTKLLLNAGADAKPALFSAAGSDLAEMIKVIRAHGANAHVTNEGGWTPLHWAVQSGSVKAVGLLLRLGASPNSAIEDGDTPLHSAADGPMLDSRADAAFRFAKIAKLLVKKGAKLNVSGREGKTPLDLAEEAGADEIIRFLRRRGARNGKPTP